MKLRHFTNTDTLYIECQAGDIAETRDLDADTTIDLDKNGTLCAMTMEHAQTRTDVANIDFEEIAA